jgi:hypothetical protein
VFFGHAYTAIETRSWIYAESRGVNIATDSTAWKDLNSALRFNSTEKLPMDFDLTYFDIGMHDRVFANHQIVGGRNRSLEIAIDSEGTGELEFAGHIGSLV